MAAGGVQYAARIDEGHDADAVLAGIGAERGDGGVGGGVHCAGAVVRVVVVPDTGFVRAEDGGPFVPQGRLRTEKWTMNNERWTNVSDEAILKFQFFSIGGFKGQGNSRNREDYLNRRDDFIRSIANGDCNCLPVRDLVVKVWEIGQAKSERFKPQGRM